MKYDHTKTTSASVARSYTQGWKTALERYYKSSQQKQRLQPICLLLLLWLPSVTAAQTLTQTVRGKIIDQEAQSPLPGANVLVLGTDPLLGSSTEADGSFRIERVPVGRHTLKISCVGYEDAQVPEFTVGSGKEVVLTIRLTESLIQMDELVVTAESEKGKPNNELAFISARSFTVEETKRYAASINDPARMALSFAGVASTDDGSNNIVIRGNSPRGVLWRLEGIEVPNPNHFGEEGASGGGVSMLSVNALDNSDFYTGAFPAEYGNAASGVFDIKLRKGNSEQREYALQTGLLGIDFAAEGPFSPNQRASYLVNYRYSTLGILGALGIDVVGDAVPNFQDLTFKVHVPTLRAGSFSIWGLGGLSRQATKDEGDQESFRYDMGTSGLSHVYFFGSNTYAETTLSYAKTVNSFLDREPANRYVYDEKFTNNSLRGSWLLNHKFNARHTVRTGLIVSRLSFDLFSQTAENDTAVIDVDARGATYLLQSYGQWKWRINEQFTLNAGLHHMHFALNGNASLEPRAGLRWELTARQALNLGFGIHSRLDPLVNYFASFVPDGSALPVQPNRQLELTKARHYVIGYENRLREDLHLKVEAYYQQLYDVPIGFAGGHDAPWYSTFSMINYEGGIVSVPLRNNGIGQNRGVELTLEKFFTKQYYFMLTGSLFKSGYTPLDGKEYSTRFNGNHVLNLLGGKEFQLGGSSSKVLAINLRALWAGGNRYTPVDLAASRRSGDAVYQWNRRYAGQVKDYLRADVRVSFRRNRARYTSTISLDIQNVTNRQNVFSQYYSNTAQDVVSSYQIGLVPVLNYRVEF